MTTNDLENKLAVITGANSGIGLEACVQLARRGCDVVMCCRSVNKAEAAKEDVLARSGADSKKVHVVQLDLADLDNIDSFRSRYDAINGVAQRPVDMLILNAGIMALNKREVSPQGIEAQMATNVVGHFKFAAVMFDLCKAAASCRIVLVSSGAHKMASTIDFKDFNREKSYSKWRVYAETKLGNLLLMAKLNRVLEEKGISNVTVVGCHPGYSGTNLQAHTIFRFTNSIFAQSPEQGAWPTVLAATDLNAKPNSYAGPSGIFEAWGQAKWGCGVNKAVWNTQLQDDLWEKCETLSQTNFAAKI